ncbi:glycosyltransferase family 4 protein [Acidobacteriota bacterium]
MAETRDCYKTIAYLTFASFPSKAAHSVHIMSMCASLSHLGYGVQLFGNLIEGTEDILKFYGTQEVIFFQDVRIRNVRFVGRILALIRSFFLVKKHKPDLMYTRDVFNGLMASMSKIPFVFELHEIPSNRIRTLILKRIVRSPGLRRLIFISSKMKQRFEKEFPGLGTEGIIAHDGVDIEKYAELPPSDVLRKRFDLPQEFPIVGYAGSLFPGRGGEVILPLARSFPDVRFLVVGGEGEYLERFQQETVRTNLTNVISIGFVPHSSVPGYLSACDVLLMPYQRAVLHRQSRHDTVQYMSPLKMFEYLASGVPVISSRLPALEEVLQDGKNSLLVEPDRIEAWKEALNKLLSDRIYGKVLANQAKKDVTSYSWMERARLIMDFSQE